MGTDDEDERMEGVGNDRGAQVGEGESVVARGWVNLGLGRRGSRGGESYWQLPRCLKVIIHFQSDSV